MIRNFNIELEDNLYQQLKELCKGEESAMREYILQTLKEKLNQNDLKKLSKDKKSLESYLNKGQGGSRNYGVKGQGWWIWKIFLLPNPDLLQHQTLLRIKYGY